MTPRLILPLCAVLAVIAAPLAGCASFDRAIGKTRIIPDEFQVVTNDPLAIPPNYALRPPRVGNGADRLSPTQQARETVFKLGDPKQAALPSADSKLSAGEITLLRETGGATASPKIRQEVDTDPQQGVPFERGLVDKLIFWSGPTTPPADEVINPTKEEARLRESHTVARTGAAPVATPADGAGTPTFERTKKSSSWLDSLF